MGNVSRIEHKDEKGREHGGYKDTFWVNYFEYTILAGNKINYHNSWVTDIHIDRGNIKQLVRGGRSRWTIENETFNTLKNQGYHLEHNFGHGKKNLSINFFLLNLLAFFMHQILELTDILYIKSVEQYLVLVRNIGIICERHFELSYLKVGKII